MERKERRSVYDYLYFIMEFVKLDPDNPDWKKRREEALNYGKLLEDKLKEGQFYIDKAQKIMFFGDCPKPWTPGEGED
ncbi:MAG: hypothetical protein ACETWK_03140 [Candidatus Aminicenantaceae bacterium]